MNEDKMINQIVDAYVENAALDAVDGLLPIGFNVECRDTLTQIHQNAMPLDFKRMYRDLNNGSARFNVFGDIFAMIQTINKQDWMFDDFTPEYRIKETNRRSVGRPVAQGVEVFRERYKPESKIYPLDGIIETNYKHVWTLEQRPLRNPKGDKLYILPGIRYNDKVKQWEVIGYLKATVPWLNATEQFTWNRLKDQLK
jgi:hypothetical protein